MRILIKNGYIVSMASEVRKGDILIEDDRIARIGNIDCDADKIIDATNKIVMPGLINAHTHVGMSLFRGYADEDELNEINTPVLEGFINAVINLNGDANGYTETRPESYEESPYTITNEGNVITITAKDGFDIETVKLISINGANYVGFTADGGKIVITIA